MSAQLINIANLVFNRPWCILPETYQSICDVVRRRMDGVRLTDEEIERIIAKGETQAERGIYGKIELTNIPSVQGAASAAGLGPASGVVSIIPIHGIMGHRSNVVRQASSKYGTSTEIVGSMFDSAIKDSDVGAVVFDIDSPGGMHEGAPELAAKIFNARGKKPIVAVANGTAASAAVYVGSAADKFYVLPSGLAGSIGSLMRHVDVSKAAEMEGIKETVIFAGKYKNEGTPLEPLGDEARGQMQKIVDAAYNEFVADVAKHRGVSISVVRNDFGQGRMLLADEAVAVGLADGVATMDEVLASLGARPASGGERRSEAESSVDLRRKRMQLRERQKNLS